MIDWSVFDKYPENTVECQCGATYRSHTQVAIGADGKLRIHSRKPCPSCVAQIGNAVAARSDPEEYTIGKKDE